MSKPTLEETIDIARSKMIDEQFIEAATMLLDASQMATTLEAENKELSTEVLNRGKHIKQLGEIADNLDTKNRAFEAQVKELEAVKLVNEMLIKYMIEQDVVTKAVLLRCILRVEDMCAELQALNPQGEEKE